jgi:thiamine biosynthesis lipoprotein
MLKRIFNGLARHLGRKELSSRSFRCMGGVATVALGASCSRHIESVTAKVRALLERLESELSTRRFDSFISLLAKNAGVAPIPLSQDAYRVLSLAKQFDDLSGGASDVTVAPLVNLWGFGRTEGRGEIPSDEAIRELLPLVDHRRIKLEGLTAFLPEKGMAVDLGGIAKGYAVDRAFELCREAGMEDFLVDLSGNLRVCGVPRRRESWEIGVRDPLDRDRIVGGVTLQGGMALASSGNYERFIEVACQRYSHVIDPRTGFPAQGTTGVTVLAKDATTADGLSTSFLVEGLKGAKRLLAESPSVDVLIVPDRYPPEFWMTPGFARVLALLPDFSKAARILLLTSA